LEQRNSARVCRTARTAACYAKVTLLAHLLMLPMPERAAAGLGFGEPVPVTDGHAGTPALASDEAGHWIAAWCSFNVLPQPGEIHVSRSVDNGATWSQPAILRPEFAPVERCYTPALAADAHGLWTVAIAVDGQLAVVVSTDDGLTWGEPQPLASPSHASYPSIATDRAGTWLVAWQSGNESPTVVSARSTDGAASWSPASQVLPGGPRVRMATDRMGAWVAVVEDDRYEQRNIVALRSLDAGLSWQTTGVLADERFELFANPDLATDGHGRWIAVWSNIPDYYYWPSVEGWGIWFARSTDNGASWSEMSRLHPSLKNAKEGELYPRVSWVRADSWTAVWQSHDSLGRTTGTDADIHTSVSRDGGSTWSSPAALVARAHFDGLPAVEDSVPAIASDGDARSIVAWALYDPAQNRADIVAATAQRDCASIPREDCRHTLRPGGSRLSISDLPGGHDRLRWKWKRGEATSDLDLGDPTATDSYVVCLYAQGAGGQELVGEWDAPSATSCNGIACWTKRPSRVDYSDPRGRNGAITSVSVHADIDEQARIKLQAGGANLGPPLLPLTTPVRIQLVNLGAHTCWDGLYDRWSRNDATRFDAVSQ